MFPIYSFLIHHIEMALRLIQPVYLHEKPFTASHHILLLYNQDARMYWYYGKADLPSCYILLSVRCGQVALLLVIWTRCVWNSILWLFDIKLTLVWAAVGLVVVAVLVGGCVATPTARYDLQSDKLWGNPVSGRLLLPTRVYFSGCPTLEHTCIDYTS